MTNPTPNSLSPQDVPNDSARCFGSATYEDGKFYWREGCDDCQRRYGWAGDGWAGDWIEPPPIIAFECEYRIGPDKNAALVEHAPGPKPLSPAAQAVLDAFLNCSLNNRQWHDGMGPQLKIAAALRALAVRIKGADAIRQDIFTIATELEGRP